MPRKIVAPDENALAAKVVMKATGTPLPKGVLKALLKKQAKARKLAKNPAAVALGRLGGLKGGKARAEALSPKKRSEIAKKAAATRWKRQKKVTQLVSEGLSTPEVAARLKVTPAVIHSAIARARETLNAKPKAAESLTY